jgi:large subunit ribosomal protein L21
MYAVFQSGSKQYRAFEGQKVRIDKLDIDPGKVIEINKVMMVSNGQEIKIGSPSIPSCKVRAEVLNHGRDKKIKIIKFRRRKHSRKQQGHRQWFTEVKITSIEIAHTEGTS